LVWQIEQWAAGYVSGMAVMQSLINDFLKGLDQEATFGWLDNYCSAHPLEQFLKPLLQLPRERGSQ
jgi:hypothetical protein